MRLILVAVLISVAACSRGGGDAQNFGVASGNSLTPAEIDAALGPANQQTVNSLGGENALASANSAATNENGNGAGPLRRHAASNAAG